jgi:hypothetical protein
MPDLDVTRVRLLGNRILVQEIRQTTVGRILIPRDMSQGGQGRVLSVGPGPLCADIYPGDLAILRSAAPCQLITGDVWCFSAVDVWGVVRDGQVLGVADKVCVRLDPEAPDVDARTGLWTPTEGREYPCTGWAEWEGQDYHVTFDTRRPQRRIRIATQDYVLLAREHLTGYVEDGTGAGEVGR